MELLREVPEAETQVIAGKLTLTRLNKVQSFVRAEERLRHKWKNNSAGETARKGDQLDLTSVDQGVPSVGLFGPTDPAHYRPLGERSRFLWMGETMSCSPCHDDGFFPVCQYEHQCMRDLSVEKVAATVKEIL